MTDDYDELDEYSVDIEAAARDRDIVRLAEMQCWLLINLTRRLQRLERQTGQMFAIVEAPPL